MSYHGTNVKHAPHYLGGDTVPPRLIAHTLGTYGGLGSDEKKEALKRAKLEKKYKEEFSKVKPRPLAKPDKVTVKNGKVAVPVTSLWSDWNKTAKSIVSPFADAIRAMPLPSSVRSDLINTPLDAMMNMFDPIEDAVGRAVDRVLAKKGNTQNYFGTSKNLKRVQSVDLKADASTQNFMKRIRTIDAFFVLFFTQPIDLAAEMAKEGLNIAKGAMDVVGEMAKSVADAVGKTANDIMKAGKDAADEVASWFGLGGYHGIGSLGDGGVASGPAAATAVTATAATAGIGVEAAIASVITAVTGALTAAVSKMAADTVTRGVEVATNGVINLIDPSKPIEPLPTNSVPSAAVVANTPGFATNTSPIVVQGSASSNLLPVVIVGGAAVAAFFLLRR